MGGPTWATHSLTQILRDPVYCLLRIVAAAAVPTVNLAAAPPTTEDFESTPDQNGYTRYTRYYYATRYTI
ncbi:hypothetical protein FS842_008079 [Serendipita sp. 407]|nr:hypothetical protein FRC15_001104 [Serendipita sp. 397]KAG8846726.1 hypothetical protein FRC20_002923 [Serendipita sp. 405]KAG9018786.1 hypothetical protein FS842_008079 [Serendipita sp. 407]